MSIVLARIDDRLIHGQVVAFWVANKNANKILIMDDETANDELVTIVCKGLAPMGTTVEVFSIDQSITYLEKNINDQTERILLLVKSPHAILKAIEKGIPLKEVVVGGMGKLGDRKPIYRNICADEEEKEIFKRIDKLGCKVIAQILPKDKPVDLAAL